MRHDSMPTKESSGDSLELDDEALREIEMLAGNNDCGLIRQREIFELCRSYRQHASLMQCAEALRECRAWIDETYVVDSCRHERDADCYSCQAISLFDRIDEALSSLEMRPDLVERLGGT